MFHYFICRSWLLSQEWSICTYFGLNTIVFHLFASRTISTCYPVWLSVNLNFYFRAIRSLCQVHSRPSQEQQVLSLYVLWVNNLFFAWTIYLLTWTIYFLIWTNYFPIWTILLLVWTIYFLIWTNYIHIRIIYFPIGTIYFLIFKHWNSTVMSQSVTLSDVSLAKFDLFQMSHKAILPKERHSHVQFITYFAKIS
jgi:hypothetical protein